MARVLVIGYGNPLRSDDGLGWRVAEALVAGNVATDAEVITCQQLHPEMADPISRAELVIFLDAETREAAALQDGEAAALDDNPAFGLADGTIVERDLVPECQSPGCFSHDLTPSTLLACSAELFGCCPTGKMFSVVGSDFGMGERLSPSVEAAIPELLRRVEDCCRAPEQVQATGTGRQTSH